MSLFTCRKELSVHLKLPVQVKLSLKKVLMRIKLWHWHLVASHEIQVPRQTLISMLFRPVLLHLPVLRLLIVRLRHLGLPSHPNRCHCLLYLAGGSIVITVMTITWNRGSKELWKSSPSETVTTSPTLTSRLWRTRPLFLVRRSDTGKVCSCAVSESNVSATLMSQCDDYSCRYAVFVRWNMYVCSNCCTVHSVQAVHSVHSANCI